MALDLWSTASQLAEVANDNRGGMCRHVLGIHSLEKKIKSECGSPEVELNRIQAVEICHLKEV